MPLRHGKFQWASVLQLRRRGNVQRGDLQMSALNRWIAYHAELEAKKRIGLARLPCAITIIGAALSLAWLFHLVPWWIGVIGLLFDVADGFVARKLQVSTDYGSLLDWSVDMLLFAVAISRALPPETAMVVLIGALPIQVGLRAMDLHFCGRALAFAVLFAREVFT